MPSWIRNGEATIPTEQPCDCKVCASNCYWKPKSAAGSMVINIAKTHEPHIFQYYQNSPEGLGYTRQAASKRVKSLAKQADIPYLSTHALRATAATIFATNDFNAAELCLVVGWTDIARAWY